MSEQQQKACHTLKQIYLQKTIKNSGYIIVCN
jgi:hypothetical protein